MTIKTRLEQEDETTANLWYFQLYGPSTNGVVKLAVTSQQLSAGQLPSDWVTANLVAAQALVDTGITNSFTIKQEAKNFLANNPNAEQLIDLAPDSLESAIENRTAGQETLLLKALSFSIRYLYARVKEDSI